MQCLYVSFTHNVFSHEHVLKTPIPYDRICVSYIWKFRFLEHCPGKLLHVPKVFWCVKLLGACLMKFSSEYAILTVTIWHALSQFLTEMVMLYCRICKMFNVHSHVVSCRILWCYICDGISDCTQHCLTLFWLDHELFCSKSPLAFHESISYLTLDGYQSFFHVFVLQSAAYKNRNTIRNHCIQSP